MTDLQQPARLGRLRTILPIVSRVQAAIAAGAFVAGGLAGWLLAQAAGLTLSSPLHPNEAEFGAVLVRNMAVVVCMAIGVVTFGAITLAILVLNGMVVGVAINLLDEAGLGSALWTGLAPHFVPEVGAFVLAAAADLWLVAALVRWLSNGARPAREQVARRWLLPQLAAFLLLALAALLETYVSAVA